MGGAQLVLWLLSVAVLAGLLWLGVRARHFHKPPAKSEAEEMLRLWLEEWFLIDDIVKTAFDVGTANPAGIKAIRNDLGRLSEPELRAAVAAFLQHRNVRKQVAKYMSWRYQLPKDACMKKLNELSEAARA